MNIARHTSRILLTVLVLMILTQDTFAQSDITSNTALSNNQQQQGELASQDSSRPNESREAELRFLLENVRISEPLDIVLLQDETSSFRDDIGNLEALAPQLWDSLEAVSQAGFRMSIIGFRDFARDPWGDRGDWVYRLHQDFTTSRDEYIVGIDALSAVGGNDKFEAQYAALRYLLVANSSCIDSNGDGDCTDSFDTAQGEQPSFRTGARRIILLATDNSFHTPENTPAYPGPSGSDVLELLQSTRSILIGLEPSDLYIPELRELAAATGGSVQSTGSSGEEVINAIIRALGEVRPVSPQLSYATVQPSTALADGAAAATVSIFLRDTAGNPVSGKDIYLQSSRASDIIYQPTLPTDVDGVTQASISSIEPGTSQIYITDVSDGIQLAEPVQIEFTEEIIPSSEELLKAIDLLQRYSITELDAISGIAQDAGLAVDSFRSQITKDKVELAFSALTGAFDVFGSVGSLELDDAGQWILRNKYPGVAKYAGEQGWKEAFSVFTNNVKLYEFGSLYDDAVRIAVRNGDWSTIVWLAREEGANYLARQLVEEVGREVVIDDGIGRGLEWLASAASDLHPDSNAGSELGYNTQQDIATVADHVNTQINEVKLDAIPSIDLARQQAFAEDLRMRAGVPIVLGGALRYESNVLDNLDRAHDSINTDGAYYFLLKFSGQILSNFVDGARVAYSLAILSLEAELNSKKLEASQLGYQKAWSILSDSMMTATTLSINAQNGIAFLRNNSLPSPVRGEIKSIEQHSEGIAFFVQKSYADVTIENQSEQTVNVELISNYMYNARILGLPWAQIPMTVRENAQLAPGETKTIRVVYKDGATGGTPIKGTFISFGLLAVTDAGTYSLDAYFEPWEPRSTVTNAQAASYAAIEAEIPEVENPVDVYITSDVEQQNYSAEIWVSNPYTQTIDATITQTLPEGATVLDTDGIVSGNIVVWEREIAAFDIEQITLTFKYATAPGTTFTLQPAQMSFDYESSVRSASVIRLETESNESTIEAVPSIAATATVPTGEVGVESSVPVIVTNYIADFKSGNVTWSIWSDASTQVYSNTMSFDVDGLASVELDLAVPGSLSEGVYTISADLETEGYRRTFVRSAYLILAASEMSLDTGWNLISTSLEPLNPRPSTVSSGNGVVLSYEQGGTTYDPELPEFSTLSLIDGEHGYWVYSESERTMTLHGIEFLPSDTRIELEPGWNLVSYLAEEPLPVDNALTSIEGLYSTVLGYDAGAMSYHTEIPPQLSTLQVMEPDKGYWIYMNGSGVLDYSGALTSTVASDMSSRQNRPQTHHDVRPTNEWIDVYSTNSTYNGVPLPVGSVVAAVGENGRLLGRMEVTNEGWYGLLAVYGDDSYTDVVDGARSREAIRFLINGQEATVVNGITPTWTRHGDLFEVNLSAQGPELKGKAYLPVVSN